jgi:3,4-dihydroxy 2-butanone 4-phosphate synthase / GTP cyclohydrolase II
MSRLPELLILAKEHNLKIISIADLIAYRMKHESSISRQVSVDMPTTVGDFKLIAFTVNSTGQEHLALVKGEWSEDEPVLVRVHSSCVTGDIFGSCRCDCGPQLEFAMKMIEKEGKGVVLYLFQEGRGIGLTNKLRAYKLQEEGYDTVEANIKLGFLSDQRDYGIGAQILHNLGLKKIRLLSNNPKKRSSLTGFGLEIIENVAIEVGQNIHNEKYLNTKATKMGHTLKFDK